MVGQLGSTSIFAARHRMEALQCHGLSRGEDRDGHVFGNQIIDGHPSYEGKIRLARGWIPDLDVFKAHSNQQVEHAGLAFEAHRSRQSLTTVAQVDRTPQRRSGQDLRGQDRAASRALLGPGASPGRTAQTASTTGAAGSNQAGRRASGQATATQLAPEATRPTLIPIIRSQTRGLSHRHRYQPAHENT